jgi:hypothetical protein
MSTDQTVSYEMAFTRDELAPRGTRQPKLTRHHSLDTRPCSLYDTLVCICFWRDIPKMEAWEESNGLTSWLVRSIH